jgi:hypothetical protein
VTIVGDAFEPLFRLAATSMQMPDLGGVLTPYPVALDASRPSRMAERVAVITAATVACLTERTPVSTHASWSD